MLNELTFAEGLKLLWPLILLQFGLAAYCLTLLARHRTRTLSKPLWAFLILFLNLLGPVLYLFLGKGERA